MAEYLIQDTSLTNIANAIRSKNGETTTYSPSQMVTAIEEISFNPQLVVICESGSEVSVTNGTDIKQEAENNGLWFFNGLEAGEWTVTGSKEGVTTSKTVNIADVNTSYCVSLVISVIPDFTYTGCYQVVADDDTTIEASKNNWKIRLLTSGILKIIDSKGQTFDLFAVGGGGGGGCEQGGGGGGGYTATVKNITLTGEQRYTVEIGTGGSGSIKNNVVGVAGGSSSLSKEASYSPMEITELDFDMVNSNVLIYAGGGSGGGSYEASSRKGGSGGSGGGGGGTGGKTAGNGGSDGSDGTSGNSGYTVGNGQGTTTREFGDDAGTLYAGGGAGGDNNNAGAFGGSGGGGHEGKPASDNTGGGGGGGSIGATGGRGGSGIIIIRNAREIA